MNQRITAGFLCLLLAAAPMLGGCEKDRGTGAGYLFSYTLDANPQSLDPQLATDEASLTVIGNLFSGLFRMDDTGNVVPDVAESYEISPDGCTYTVHMRKDNYWYSLGDARQETTRTDSEDAAKHAAPVTAADFVYAFQRLFDPRTGSPYRERFAALKNGQRIMDGELDCTQIGVDASDTYTVVFTLDRPDANFLSLLATTAAMPCNPSFFYGCKGRYGLDEDSVISNGAFYLRMWFYDPYGKENQIYMRRNALNSRAKQVYPSNLTFYIQDAQKAEQNFRDSLTDCLITADSSYAASGKYTTLSYESVTYGLIFNPRHSQYSNASLRKALSLGARSADYAPMLGADTTEAFALVPPAVRMLGKEYRELVSQQSVQPAGQDAAVLYTQALEELGIASLESAQILVPAGLTDYAALHEIVRRWSDLFGFYIGIDPVDPETYAQRLQDGEYAIALYGTGSDYNSPAGALQQLLEQQGMLGMSEQTLRDVQAQLQEAAGVENLSGTLEHYRAAERLLLEDACFIPLFYKQEYLVFRPDNEDLAFDPFTGQVFFADAKHFE